MSDGDSTATTTSSPQKTPKVKKAKTGSGTNTTPSKVAKKSPAPKGSGKKAKAVKSEPAVDPRMMATRATRCRMLMPRLRLTWTIILPTKMVRRSSNTTIMRVKRSSNKLC